MRKSFLLVATAAVASAMMLFSCGKSQETAEATVEEEVPVEATPEIPSWMPDSVTITSSGLGVVITNPGDSVRANATTPVTLHYSGRLPDGTVFDSSYDRGEPATFSAGGVIQGFGEGIQMVGQGGKATLYIPYYLGYGAQGAGPIPPYSNLIFDIEVLEINN